MSRDNPFNQLLKRISEILAAFRTTVVRTDLRRWEKTATQVPPWDIRNQTIARLIPAGSSVLDLGAGAQTLRTHLPTDCQYQPCDVVRGSDQTILCDFNGGQYPKLPRHYDFVVCSGVLEYVREPARFFFEVRNYGRIILLSYHPWRAQSTVINRLANGWVNHMPADTVQALFEANGLTWRIVDQDASGQLIYELKHKPCVIGLGFDFYGAGNIGDDLMLQGFAIAIQKLDINQCGVIHAVSSHNIESQQKRFPQFIWSRPGGAGGDSPQQITCWAGVGDTPFQVTSGPWFLDFLRQELDRTKNIARHVLVGVGAESEIERELDAFTKIAAQCDRISVRDQHSYRILTEKLGVQKDRISAAADLANISLSRIFKAPSAKREFELGIIVAGDTLAAQDIQQIGHFAEAQNAPFAWVACETRDEPIFEKGIRSALISAMPHLKSKLILCAPAYGGATIEELVAPIAACETILSSRYHGLLAAAWAGCRVATIGRSSKVVALAEELELPLAPLPLDAEKLAALTREAVVVPRAKLEKAAMLAHAAVEFSIGDLF